MDKNVSTMTMPKTMPAQNFFRYISFLSFVYFGNHPLVLRKQIVGQTNTYSCPNEIRTDFSDIVYTALLYIPEESEGLKIRGAISISPH